MSSVSAQENTTKLPPEDIACFSAAIEARSSALIDALDEWQGDVKVAIMERNDGIIESLALERDARFDARRNVFVAYTEQVRLLDARYEQMRNNAFANYRSAVNDCRS
ncbi:hypothetical protein COV82_00790 [Candidatus Peregrinibacteria bacterium CG11_big_fil_rev_8_21_14_0_20_46_8]|nr:MAG: hypothetical protein COV82_00790 [Candidatus Peregrinibacteria bacterium CG11_big_fil_rev_8_21_14_0_20_46_8]